MNELEGILPSIPPGLNCVAHSPDCQEAPRLATRGQRESGSPFVREDSVSPWRLKCYSSSPPPPVRAVGTGIHIYPPQITRPHLQTPTSSDHLLYKLGFAQTQTRGALRGNERWASTFSLLRACKLLISKWVVCPPSHKSLSILLHIFFFHSPPSPPSLPSLPLSGLCENERQASIIPPVCGL